MRGVRGAEARVTVRSNGIEERMFFTFEERCRLEWMKAKFRFVGSCERVRNGSKDRLMAMSLFQSAKP